MRILHMVAGAKTGGAETFSFDAIKALHDQGIEQFVICRDYDHLTSAFDERGIPYITITYNKILKLFEQRKIIKAIEEFAPDLVHGWMARAASFVPKEARVPVLGWFGGYYDLKYYKSCDYFMGVTRDIVRHIKEHIAEPSRAYVGHTFGTLPEDAPVARADLGVPKGSKTVLLLSRMHWKKGVDTLLEAARSLPDVYFLLAGDGPDMEKYKAMAKDLGVEERAIFLGWRTDRAALLSCADICVLPSRYEPFGTVIAESWFAGVPLIAAKAAGASQYVTHEKDGLLHEIDAADELAAHIKRVLGDEELQKSLIKHGQQTYKELFSKEVVVSELMKSYQEMIEAGK